MKQKYTSDESFEKVINFAKSINMITLPLYKEKSGYLLNSMLIPFLFSALDLLAKEISDVESIDLAWKKGTGSPKGPFEILDIIGLKTAYEIVSMYLKIPSFLAPYNFKAIAKLLQKYIDEGKLGKSTKEGFYKYD
jgi:3-hydroxyacyl-CoA dehydrogenase